VFQPTSLFKDKHINNITQYTVWSTKYMIQYERTPSQAYSVSLVIWDHTVLPDTRHKWTHPALTTRQASTLFTYPGGMEGW